MRADVIGAQGRIAQVSATQVGSHGRIARRVGRIIRDNVEAFVQGFAGYVADSSIAAFILGYDLIKVFERVAEMDTIFRGDAEM